MQSSHRRHFLNEAEVLHFAQNLFVVKDSALPEDACEELFQRALHLREAQEMRSAVLAQGMRNENVRGDQISWLEQDDPSLQVLGLLRSLQEELNELFFLGLDHFETHLALYGPGKGYQTHLDQPQQQGLLPGEGAQRWITFVLYLNKNWQTGDGGELELQLQLPERPRIVEPLWNRMLLFRSDKILHQVLVSQKDRWSLTGWFKKRH